MVISNKFHTNGVTIEIFYASTAVYIFQTRLKC